MNHRLPPRLLKFGATIAFLIALLAFFARVAGYTQRKFIFDLNPRQYRAADVLVELRAAGFDRLELRPFFAPQTVSLPSPLTTALHVLERSGPFARLLLAVRFSYLCAAFRGGRNT